MPKFATEGQHYAPGANNHFGFSGMRIADLQATEYTLGCLVVDTSGSVSAFRDPLTACIKDITEACRKNPRADNMMMRLTTFNSRLQEFHGFKLLAQCNPSDYDGAVMPAGMTALYDATLDGIQSLDVYGLDLAKNDYAVNGILFVLTDGLDNESTRGVNDVHDAFKKVISGEHLESIVSILIGVNTEPTAQAELERYAKEAGFTQFIDIGEADSKKLARLSQFVSQSISSQSQALGTGGPSKVLTF